MQLLTKQEIEQLNRSAYQMRKDILKMCFACGTQKGHLGGCLSAVELLAVLYAREMNVIKANTGEISWDDRDRFIMSKGHAGIAMYAALKQAGILTDKEIELGIRGEETILYRHPKRNIAYGIECSVGSLGMGIGYAVGLAEVFKREKSSSKAYVMVGDGECDEGSVWEAAAYASHKRLDNLIVIIDKNRLQLDGYTSDILAMDNIEERWRAFGFTTVVIDGHNVEEIARAFTTEHIGSPLAIVANTVKGKGVSFAENKVEWHDNYLSEELYEQALREIDGNQQSVKLEYKTSVVQKGSNTHLQNQKEYKTKQIIEETTNWKIRYTQEQIEEFVSCGYKDIVGNVAEKIAAQDSRFALLYSDCANRIGIMKLKDLYPQMCYEMGIAEQNQIMVASALALENYDVFAIAYAPFITARVLDQIRTNLGYMKSPVKLIGLAAGFASSDLGATHTALEDIANMRGIPNMTVIAPADILETAKAMFSVAKLKKPVYLRLTAGLTADQVVYEQDYKFQVGKAVTLKEGKRVAIISCGAITKQVLDAAGILEDRGISCKVINMHTIKPLDIESLKKLQSVELVVTVEEHNVIGGLGSAVSEYYATYGVHPPVMKIGIPDTFYIADIPSESFRRAGLLPKQIAEKIIRVLS